MMNIMKNLCGIMSLQKDIQRANEYQIKLIMSVRKYKSIIEGESYGRKNKSKQKIAKEINQIFRKNFD